MAYIGTGRDVADPWYTGDFEEDFQDILEGCEGMMRWRNGVFHCIVRDTLSYNFIWNAITMSQPYQQ